MTTATKSVTIYKLNDSDYGTETVYSLDREEILDDLAESFGDEFDRDECEGRIEELDLGADTSDQDVIDFLIAGSAFGHWWGDDLGSDVCMEVERRAWESEDFRDEVRAWAMKRVGIYEHNGEFSLVGNRIGSVRLSTIRWSNNAESEARRETFKAVKALVAASDDAGLLMSVAVGGFLSSLSPR